MPYSNSEYYDMIMCVGASDGNLLAARRLYRARYENRVLPSNRCFRNLVNRLHTSGSFHPPAAEAGHRRVRDPQVEEQVLNFFHEDSTRSTRMAARVLDLPQTFVWRTLKKDFQHPYHYRPVQELLETDQAPRVNFCRWYLSEMALDPGVADNILWTDEASFTRGGLFNVHNDHRWSHENPHCSRESSFQHRWKINVWAGILGRRLIGPFFLPDTLSGVSYLSFLQNDLEDELENLPVPIYRDMIFQHDGAPAHYSRSVKDYLNNRFGSRWIGRGGSVSWPARSPDLTPLDFFLWGYVKNEVYRRVCETEREMRATIITVFTDIKNKEDMLLSVRDASLRRAIMCIQNGGGHFEQNL